MPREASLLCADRAFVPHAPPDTLALMGFNGGALSLDEALAHVPEAEAEDFGIPRRIDPAEADVQHDTWGARGSEFDRILDAELWGVHNLDGEGELQAVQAAIVESEFDEDDELPDELRQSVQEFWENRKKYG